MAFSETDKTKCVSCGFGTVLQDGKCIGAINCETPSAQCSNCLDGFTLKDEACTDSTGDCQTVGSNGVCKTCN